MLNVLPSRLGKPRPPKEIIQKVEMRILEGEACRAVSIHTLRISRLSETRKLLEGVSGMDELVADAAGR